MVKKNLYGLTGEQRLDAADAARTAVMRRHGSEPQRDDYRAHIRSEYPPALSYAVSVMLAIIFFAAGTVSFFRTFNIARDHYLSDINVYWQGALTGVAVFLMAEFLVIASMLSIRVWARYGFQKFILVLAIIGGTATALVANWSLVEPNSVFAVIETIMPPFSVIALSMIFEMIIGDYAQYYQSVNNAFIEAHREWSQVADNAEESEYWLPEYANALKEKLWAVNAKGRGKTERIDYMQTLSDADWIGLVRSEMKADNWFVIPEKSPNGRGGDPDPLALPEVYTESAP